MLATEVKTSNQDFHLLSYCCYILMKFSPLNSHDTMNYWNCSHCASQWMQELTAKRSENRGLRKLGQHQFWYIGLCHTVPLYTAFLNRFCPKDYSVCSLVFILLYSVQSVGTVFWKYRTSVLCKKVIGVTEKTVTFYCLSC